MSIPSGSPSGPSSDRPTLGGAERLRRVGADVAAGAQSAARVSLPVVRSVSGRIAEWLASVTWGKFFVVALLLLILAGALSSFMNRRGPALIIDDEISDAIKVDVSAGPAGIIVAPPRSPAAPVPPKPPRPAQSTAAPPSGSADHPEVKVDDDGVRIVSKEKDGRTVAVVIDGKGIRVEELPRKGVAVGSPARGEVDKAGSDTGVPAREPAAAAGAVTIATDLNDPEAVEQALEAARGTIERIVADQVRRQVSRRVRDAERNDDDWIPGLVALLILAAVIVKIVLGSKKRAEVRAQAATMTAAEEGLKRQLAEAQLKMMQAQVEPHFLFNTLASVDYLIETDPARASTMQKNLIQYLRAALPQMREGSTTLGKEVSLCRSYLEILKVRMDDRLQFVITVPRGLSTAQFPPMMLQSLVENAIKHGLEPKAEGGSLTISADVSNGSLHVTVADTGLGFGENSQPGMGVGLGNIHERLLALYGRTARLSIEANTPSGTIATIEVPYTYEVNAAETAARKAPPSASAQPA